jgi:KTSC domain
MTSQQQSVVKMVSVNADAFEAIGYATGARQLFIKFRNAPALCFNNVPGFRYEGLMAAPRKDAYYNTFIKNFFISKPAEPQQLQY